MSRMAGLKRRTLIIMQALYFKNGQLDYRRDEPKPPAAAGEVRLSVRLAGICGTDRALLKGYADYEGVLGHEFVAVVDALGAGVATRWLGRRVVAEINQWCGCCDQCRLGHHRHCLERRVIGIRNHAGAFAQYLTVDEKLLHVVPENISDRQAVFIEPLAAACRVVEQMKLLRGERVLVVGAGSLGQLIARVLCAQGYSPDVVVRHETQRQQLADLAVQCVTEAQVVSDSMDVVIEASGHPSGLALALDAVRAAGAIVLKSAYAQPLSLDMSCLVVNEIQLIGSRCGDFEAAIAVLAEEQIDPEPLIDSVFPLALASEAFKAAARQGAMKVLLQPPEGM